jgi:hypothetical protein
MSHDSVLFANSCCLHRALDWQYNSMDWQYNSIAKAKNNRYLPYITML